MLKKGERVKIQQGNRVFEVEIIGVVNITTNSRWYDFDINFNMEEAIADYRVEENYIGKTVNNAGKPCIGQVCKYLYVGNNDKILATEIISYI